MYQEVPQPGDPQGSTRSAAEYGHAGGVILPSSGYLRVKVSTAEAKVEYIGTDKTVRHAYVVPAQKLPHAAP